MAYEKQTWISYDDNKTEEQNIKDGAVVTAERMNHIEDGVEAQATKIEFDSHLDDKENPHEVTAHQVGALTAEETSANVIAQIVSGNKEKIVFSTNFSGKVSGSLVENANSAYTSYSTELNAPTAGTWYEFSDERYSKISDLDGIRDVESHKANGQMVLIRIEYDVVDILTRVYSNNFWLSQGISTLDEKVTYIKNNVSEITPHVFGFGSGPSGNRLQLVTWRPDTKVWNDNGATAINSTNQVKDIYAKHSPVVVDQYGKINILLYSYVSDGTIPSGTSIDYSELEIALNISANDYIESKIAAYSGENIDKKFVGLENVDNYGTATQAEAESGTATDKFMTPLRTKQHVSSRIATQTEAEGGTASEKLMTPLCTKQHVDKRIATQEEVDEGEATDKIVSPKTLTEWEKERLIKYGKQTVWGENRQVTDPATVNFGDFYISDNNQYNPLPNGETYFTIDSTGIATVTKSGMYVVSAMVKRQFRTSITAWHYVSCVIKSASTGTNATWDFLPFGGTIQNRNRNFAKITLNLNVGDKIWFKSDSNNTTNALQFINIDQFMLERLGD